MSPCTKLYVSTSFAPARASVERTRERSSSNKVGRIAVKSRAGSVTGIVSNPANRPTSSIMSSAIWISSRQYGTVTVASSPLNATVKPTFSSKPAISSAANRVPRSPLICASFTVIVMSGFSTGYASIAVLATWAPVYSFSIRTASVSTGVESGAGIPFVNRVTASENIP